MEAENQPSKTGFAGKEDYGGPSRQIEERVAKELFQTIAVDIENREKASQYNDLALALKEKKNNSCSFSQIFIILGNSVGLSVKTVYALEPDSDIGQGQISKKAHKCRR